MSEHNLWNWLKPYCPRGRYCRVENGDAGPGTPDVYYRLPTNSGWMELKDARHPKSDIPFPDEEVGLHLSQKIWIREEVEFGGLVWITAQVGKQILFLPGKYAGAFNGATLKRLVYFSTLIIDKTDPAPTVKKLKRLLEGDL